MAEVVPFRGILYNASRVSGDDVVAPPYDIITPELRAVLYQKSPYNVVRIDAGQELAGDDNHENKYARASRFMEEWLREGILLRSEIPAFYAYAMDYDMPEGRKRLSGFFGLVRLTELGKGVYPHEETHAKPKVDRLNLMTACQANTSPIFSLYASPEGKASGVLDNVMKNHPYIEARDPLGAVHKLWTISDRNDVRVIQDDLAERAVFIADGHHRYETALEYQKILGGTPGNKPSDYVLMFLANTAAPGLTILPTHRIVRYSMKQPLDVLSRYFDISPVTLTSDITRAISGRKETFGLRLKDEGKQYVLTYRGGGLKGLHPVLDELDVAVLHTLIFRELLKVSDIVYEMDPLIAGKILENGDYQAVFFLNPTRVTDVEKVGLSSVRMPPKSTYFYPKVMTGFVINSLRNSF